MALVMELPIQDIKKSHVTPDAIQMLQGSDIESAFIYLTRLLTYKHVPSFQPPELFLWKSTRKPLALSFLDQK